LFALISIIYSGQYISRQLYLRQFINEQFQHVAIFPVVGGAFGDSYVPQVTSL
jgi:hypothetical protein